MTSRVLIADPRTGLQRNLESWLLPEDGYPDLQDCYVWRGRVKKRQGFRYLAQLRRNIGTTDGSGNFGPFTLINAPLNPGSSQFVVGSTVFTDPGGSEPVTLLVNGTGTATLTYSTGSISITGAPAGQDVIYYPGLPVMGLETQETSIINQTALIGFDTSFAYAYNNSAQQFQDASFYKTSLSLIYWTGGNYQQFWSTNYANALWATNSVYGFQPISTSETPASGDGIRWFDQNQSGWVNFLPPITGAASDGSGDTYLMGCLMIFPYKNRLVVLSTSEGNDYSGVAFFQQRARWSQNGTPFNTKDPSDADAPIPDTFQGGQDPNNQAWSSDIIGKGGFIDAPTNEAIVSAQFLKDTLIVYFERSTWNLRYTGNEVLPFIWEKINTELGAQSTFSVVPFDRQVMAIDNVGLHQCDTVNVVRIDEKIPDEMFQIEQLNNGPLRVSGIRDYLNELAYWSIPYRGYDSEMAQDDGQIVTFPNKFLVYNYVDKSFSFFNDSITTFGYLGAPYQDLTWGLATINWDAASMKWISPIEDQNVLQALGGNQQGYVLIMQSTAFNDFSLSIANITVSGDIITIFSPNHNLLTDSFVYITNAPGITGLTGNIYQITVPQTGSPLAPDPNNFTIQQAGVTGIYTGPGAITVVNNISILTKKFNPFIQEAAQVRLTKVDFYFETTVAGAVTANLYINEDNTTPVNLPSPNNPNLSSNTVNTFPESTYAASPDTNLVNDKLWKRMYFQDISQLFQIEITMSDEQMVDPDISMADIVLHGLILYFEKSGRLIDV